MNSIDDTIRAALGGDEAPGDAYGELRAAIGATFRRRTRALTILMWIKAASFVAGAAISAWVFAHTESVRTQIGSAALFVVFALSTGVFIVLYWMQVIHAMTARELKRLELAISRLGEKR